MEHQDLEWMYGSLQLDSHKCLFHRTILCFRLGGNGPRLARLFSREGGHDFVTDYGAAMVRAMPLKAGLASGHH